MGDFVRQKSKI